MNSLLLLDISNAAHRSRHVLELTNKGQDVSVLYGVMRIVLASIKKYEPTIVVACYDRGYPRTRKLLVPTYKEHRKAKRENSDDVDWDDFYRQIHLTQQLLRLSGVVVAEQYGMEADDLIAACVRSMLYTDCTIVSSDNDMLQLVDDRVTVVNPVKDIEYTRDRVYKELGVWPTQIPVLKALAGDSSDGVPGVRGIGDKTAAKLINNYKLRTMYDVTSKYAEFPSRQRKLIEESGGMDTIQCAYTVVVLLFDLYGANYAVWQSASKFSKFNRKLLFKLLYKYSFVSIMSDSNAIEQLKELCAPNFTMDVKYPVHFTKARIPKEEKDEA